MRNGHWVVYYIENGQCPFLDGGIELNTRLLPEVTFENSPQEVVLKLIEK